MTIALWFDDPIWTRVLWPAAGSMLCNGIGQQLHLNSFTTFWNKLLEVIIIYPEWNLSSVFPWNYFVLLNSSVKLTFFLFSMHFISYLICCSSSNVVCDLNRLVKTLLLYIFLFRFRAYFVLYNFRVVLIHI